MRESIGVDPIFVQFFHIAIGFHSSFLLLSHSLLTYFSAVAKLQLFQNFQSAVNYDPFVASSL